MSYLGTVADGNVALTGTGLQTVFAFPHGLPAQPRYVGVTPYGSLLAIAHSVTVDAANITVTFALPPAIGTANMGWLARL